MRTIVSGGIGMRRSEREYKEVKVTVSISDGTVKFMERFVGDCMWHQPEELEELNEVKALIAEGWHVENFNHHPNGTKKSYAIREMVEETVKRVLYFNYYQKVVKANVS